MIDQELIERVTHMPVAERLELLEVLTRSLRGDMGAVIASPKKHTHASAPEDADTVFAAITQRAHSIGLAVPADSSLHQLRGSAAGGVPMTKAAVRDRITDAVSDKYQ